MNFVPLEKYEPYARLSAEIDTLASRMSKSQAAYAELNNKLDKCRGELDLAEESDALDRGSRAEKVREKVRSLTEQRAGIDREVSAAARACAKRDLERREIKESYAKDLEAGFNAELEELLLAAEPKLVEAARHMGAAARLVRDARPLGIRLRLARFVLNELTFSCVARNLSTPAGVIHGDTVIETMLSRWLKGLEEAGLNVAPHRDDENSAAVEATDERLQVSSGTSYSAAQVGADTQRQIDEPKLAIGREMGARLRNRVEEMLGFRI